jgi:hypothetical protein
MKISSSSSLCWLQRIKSGSSSGFRTLVGCRYRSLRCLKECLGGVGKGSTTGAAERDFGLESALGPDAWFKEGLLDVLAVK